MNTQHKFHVTGNGRASRKEGIFSLAGVQVNRGTLKRDLSSRSQGSLLLSIGAAHTVNSQHAPAAAHSHHTWTADRETEHCYRITGHDRLNSSLYICTFGWGQPPPIHRKKAAFRVKMSNAKQLHIINIIHRQHCLHSIRYLVQGDVNQALHNMAEVWNKQPQITLSSAMRKELKNRSKCTYVRYL